MCTLSKKKRRKFHILWCYEYLREINLVCIYLRTFLWCLHLSNTVLVLVIVHIFSYGNFEIKIKVYNKYISYLIIQMNNVNDQVVYKIIYFNLYTAKHVSLQWYWWTRIDYQSFCLKLQDIIDFTEEAKYTLSV